MRQRPGLGSYFAFLGTGLVAHDQTSEMLSEG